MLPKVRKLYPENPSSGQEEILELLAGNRFKLEHIHSFGGISREGFWYDQSEDEWVALIKGGAVLEFEEGRLELVSGDWLIIPSHMKHRVIKTSLDATWIAVHFKSQ